MKGRSIRHKSKTKSHIFTQGGRIVSKRGNIKSIKTTGKYNHRKITNTTTMRNERGNRLRNNKVISHSKRRTTKHIERRR